MLVGSDGRAVARAPFLLAALLEHFEEKLGGLLGVEGAELRGELEGVGSGREVPERGENRDGWHLGRAGSDEDDVDGMDLEKDFRVADQARGVHIVAMLAEDDADEGAEIRREIDDQHATAGLVMNGRC